MPVIGHDPVRCQKRNRHAARMGLNAVPVRLMAKAPPPVDTNDPETEKGLRIKTARGTLPRTPEAAVERINRLRGEGHEPLTPEQVWIVYLEAGNNNYISKYCMFLGDSTLRNIARRGERSIAFMNSHRTGGMSTDAELPYGRTFAGRFEQAVTPAGRQFSRTLLGVYMLRGQRPNGADGPSTDDLYEGIRAGTIFDVSLGIQGGDEVCDVCGYPVDAYDVDKREPLCRHVPGTHRGMTEEEVEAATERGVPGGYASFTLEDATAGEVSPVFDGAVPGAGFRKALRAARARHLSAADLAEARQSFGPLARRRDFSADPPATPDRGRPAPQNRGPAMPPKRKTTVNASALARVLGELGIEVADDDGDEHEHETAPVAASPPARPANQPETAAAPQPQHPESRAASNSNPDVEDRLRQVEEQNARLEQTLAAERTQREEDGRKQRKATVLAQATNWADQLIRLNAATPAERQGLISLYAQAAMDDAEHPAQVAFIDATSTPKLGTRAEAFEATWAKRGRHDFTSEHIAPAANAGGAEAPAGSPPLVNLHEMTPGAPRSDPLTDRMVQAAERFQASRNGKSGNA